MCDGEMNKNWRGLVYQDLVYKATIMGIIMGFMGRKNEIWNEC